MKKTSSLILLATLVITLTVPAVSTASEPVLLAQVNYPFSCRSENGFGSWGIGLGYSPEQACANANLYCARNAPYGTVCVVVRWWRN